MKEDEKSVYLEKAEDTKKCRLAGEVHAKVAEMAKDSDKEDRQAEEALARIWFRRARELAS